MKKLILFLGLIFGFIPVVTFAAMTSTNYSIILDAIGVSGGGDNLTSASFSLNETIGETPVLTSASSNYIVEGGYQSSVFGALSFKLNTSNLSLGTLSTTTINTASVIATVTSESTGYVLSVNNTSGTMPADVTGGAVVAGTEAYGFTASGSNSLIVGDVPVAIGTMIASTTVATAADATTLTFKASANINSSPGNYNQNIELVVSANL